MSITHAWDGDVGDEKKGPSVPQAPPLPPPVVSSKRSQFGLRHIMLLSAVAAVIMAVIGRAAQTGEERDIVLALVVVTGMLFVFGCFLLTRLQTWTAIAWIVIVLAITALSIITTGWLTLVIVPVIIGGLIFAVLRRQSLEQDTLLWVLALAAERQRPLGSAMQALASQTTGVHRLRAMRLAECLEQGMPLPDSLEFVRKAASASARVLVRVGNDSGRLAESLQDAATMRSNRPNGAQNLGGQIAYFCLILTVLQVVTGFILYFIMPRFQAIFNDFGVALPAITIAVISAANFLTSNYIFPIFLIFYLCFIAYLPFAIFGYGGLNVPLLDRFFLRRHSVLILRCLAMIVEGGVPIDSGLRTLAQWYPTAWVRQRLAGAHLTHAQGLGWVDSLRQFGLINNADAALLDASIRVNNLPWALRELTESSERKLHQRVQVFSQVMMTIALMGIGALVGVFATAYFYPLVILIERLT